MNPPAPEVLSHFEVRDLAAEFLDEYWPSGTLPVNVEHIADVEIGCHIVDFFRLEERIEREAFITSDGTQIWVDQSIANQSVPHRYRFTIAHELGHLVLHQDLLQFLCSDTPEEWLRKIQSIDRDDLDWFEWQAREFAGLILAPPEPLAEQVNERVQLLRDHGGPLDLTQEHVKDRVAESVGRDPFQVSADVIRRRGEKDGLWKDYG